MKKPGFTTGCTRMSAVAKNASPEVLATLFDGDWAYEGGAQNGISIVRDRDEVYMRLRYTF